ncbi:fimbrial chaperone [Salmonella enterica subsp. enterica]|nr:fimbrial chaperone [Salmonella enterica subsp. enterica]EDW9588869.1 fimbrial chaperone [Salmonella enterica subsp. enterica]EED9671610.1 fimbrial chaperone [Salmonella enterica subsp. enterica]EIO7468726.1 fimbrial chaperone [Salmonella enterica subsp. enterica]EIY5764472.1 fimbrial chaperone [Salmonella enterica subsp. enterica]
MTRMRHSLFSIITATIALSAIQPACADIILSGTRIVYKEKQKDTTIRLENKGAKPSLVQSWLDDGDSNADPSTINVPFNATPPVARLEPGRGQTVKITYTGGVALPKDRESIYWFNVLEVPPKMKDADIQHKNMLQLAFRTRIKMFYRPDGLEGIASDAPKKLVWSMQQKGGKPVIHVTNPSSYYVSFNKVETVVGGKKYAVSSSMVAPKGESEFTVIGLTTVPAKASISYVAINDFGGAIHGKVDI